MVLRLLFSFFIFVSHVWTQDAAQLSTEAQLAFDQRDYRTALKKVDEALKMDQAEIYFLQRSKVLESMKYYKMCYDNYVQGLEIYPTSFELYNGLGLFLAKVNELDASEEILTTAYELAMTNSEKVTVLINRSVTLQSKRELNLAYKDLKEANQLDPSSVIALVNLGSICDQLNKQQEGLSFLKQALELDSNFSGIYINLGALYQKMGDYTNALSMFDKMVEKEPTEAMGYSNRAYSKLKLNDLKGAMKDAEKSLDLYPSNAYAHMVKGAIYLQLGKDRDACESLNLAKEFGFEKKYGDEVNFYVEKACK